MRKQPLSLLLFGFLCVGCKDGSDSSETSTSETSESSATDSATTGEQCSPGLEGCPCYGENLCIVGLVCLSDLCVEPPSPMTSTTTSSEPTTGDEAGEATGDTTEPYVCESNYECADDEVCFAGACGAAVFYDYEITVSSFSPPDCSDGVGTAEVIYKAYIGDAVEHVSAESGCPSSWPNETFRVGGTEIFSLEFWEVDGFSDDYFTALCWQEFGECSGIPDYVLHDYGYAGLTGDGIYSFSFFATPVEWCGNTGCR